MYTCRVTAHSTTAIEIQVLYNHATHITHSANTRGIRFGYLDRTSNFSLKFDEGESVETIFPGQNKYLETQQ